MRIIIDGCLWILKVILEDILITRYILWQYTIRKNGVKFIGVDAKKIIEDYYWWMSLDIETNIRRLLITRYILWQYTIRKNGVKFIGVDAKKIIEDYYR